MFRITPVLGESSFQHEFDILCDFPNSTALIVADVYLVELTAQSLVGSVLLMK